MTTRKPRGESHESWVDRQIREAQERGEFDDLPGTGKPLPDLGRRYDDLWWVRRKLRDENFSYLPPTLQARKEREEARRRVMAARSEREVREIVSGVNALIREVNRTALQGPASTLMPLDEEQAVSEWRQRIH